MYLPDRLAWVNLWFDAPSHECIYHHLGAPWDHYIACAYQVLCGIKMPHDQTRPVLMNAGMSKPLCPRCLERLGDRPLEKINR